MEEEPKEAPTGLRHRRDRLACAAMGPALFRGSPAHAAPPEPSKLSAAELGHVTDELLSYLAPLEDAVRELAHTWRPDDPRYRADVYRQIMMNLSYAYFVYFHADPQHPDWLPFENPVFAQQPNPDTIYLVAPMRGDLTYRVSGNRGTCHALLFTTQHGLTGDLPNFHDYKSDKSINAKDLKIDPDGEMEIIFSAKRPEGYTGNWAPLQPDTNGLMLRFVSQDWARERDPQMAIE